MTSETSVSTESRARKCRAASAGSAAGYSATAEKVGAGERAGVTATSCGCGREEWKGHYGPGVETASRSHPGHAAEIGQEGRGRDRAAQELLHHLAGRPLQTVAIEPWRHP